MVRDFVIIADIQASSIADAEAIIHKYLSPNVINDPRFDADILVGSSTSGGKRTIWVPATGSVQVPVEFAVVEKNPEEVVRDICDKFLVACPDMTDWHWSDRHRPLMEERAPRFRGKMSKRNLSDCKVEDCNKKCFSRGWCVKHYHQWYRQFVIELKNGVSQRATTS